ncbi:MAG TPA: hypothetical protein VEH77_07775, partial [Roseiarcus sp.]|nr:hypothetical protein [Roseiarcus sp.]
GCLRLVRRLLPANAKSVRPDRYYGGVRLLGLVHRRLRLLAFPTRACGVQPQAKPETSRFPCKELPHMPGSSDTPG